MTDTTMMITDMKVTEEDNKQRERISKYALFLF